MDTTNEVTIGKENTVILRLLHLEDFAVPACYVGMIGLERVRFSKMFYSSVGCALYCGALCHYRNDMNILWEQKHWTYCIWCTRKKSTNLK